MTTATISLDHECWDRKPSNTLQYGTEVDKYGVAKTEIRVLGARLGTVVEDVTPKKLARVIISGQTWSPYVFSTCPDWGRRRRIEQLFEGCQVLGVDFDNGDSREEIVARAEAIGLHFNILHHSFSSSPEHPKFRGVFFLAEKIAVLDKAKLFSTAITHALQADKACVDVARLYFGSTKESIVLFDNDSLTELDTLQAVSDAVGAEKYMTTRQSVPKEHDPDWGTISDQRKIWLALSPGKREFVKRKILGILREIESFDGSEGSRYECVWRKTSRIARMPETVGNVVKEWVLERIKNNPYFDDWDKNAEEIVCNAIAWSFEHAEPPV